ncbi:formate dehydrogenase accessory sulfurtransferase FdhD [Halopseudomonas salegens]|uniref:Sulfur carrier protein FdhD n=1 Tax=Halopseudomonas salegens TaxID=1434072 RepID=A0A1H2FVU4_9GAMM|nr:formate dehydrogenase accessory sulfurtransferase FdhD [Halopseudomonas salegens]SDU11462.1 FdhD protein [Halopseudomonas salegens]
MPRPEPVPPFSYQTLHTPAQLHDACLADEVAVAINYNDLNHAVMMASPDDLHDFAIGFSLGQGIIEQPCELLDITIQHAGDHCQLDLELSSRRLWQLKRQRRQLAGTAGCGLCGNSALEQALPQLQPGPSRPLPRPEHLAGLRQRLAARQVRARQSGAMHAAGYIDAQGELRVCREDIGRHNALDKLIGALALARLPATEGFAIVTSRCSLELVHKAVRAGLPTLVSLAAPSQLSVRWASALGLNLIHLSQRAGPRVYRMEPVL